MVAADVASATTSVIVAAVGVTGLTVVGTAAAAGAAGAAGAGSSPAGAGGGGAAAATALLGQAQFIATAGRVGRGKGTQTAGTQALSQGLDWSNGHVIHFDVADICPAMEGVPQELLGTVGPESFGTLASSFIHGLRGSSVKSLESILESDQMVPED
jgi:hypothetical protein